MRGIHDLLVVPLLTGALVAVSLLQLPRTAAAQSNAERMATDWYTPSHDYDLLHQRIEVANFDWDSTSFDGRVATTLVSLRPGMDSVILDAGPLLRLSSATDARGDSLRTARHGDTLVVFLPSPAAFGDTVRFSLGYHARIESGRGLTFIQADGREHRRPQIWSQGEAANNHYWFPTYDHPNDKMTWELVATVPHGYTAISNGRVVGDRRHRDGTRTLSWSQEKPASTYLVSLVVGQYVRVHDQWHGIPVDYFVYPEDSTRARQLFGITTDIMEVYSRLTGVDYPWAKYAQTTVADFFGGMENVSATTIVDWLPDSAAYLDRPWYQHVLIPHEIAHQWFGNYVTIDNWANMWLNEGFAEFMPGAYWAEKLGAHAGDDYYLDEYHQFMSIDKRRRMPLAALASNNIYPKGALVVRMLEKFLGPERFWAAVNLYLTRHAYGNATTDDFRQSILEATGENMGWFWNQWVYQAGYPDFAVTASYDSTRSRLTLHVKQTQSDSSKADSTGLRYTTPTVFRMPITIRVGTAEGDRMRTVWLDRREQTIEIDSLTSKPTMVVFDDDDTILKTLAFEQPTTWLATQLERDPDLWNRSWVITQLGKRTTDTLAATALASAATDADYFRTRAEAAGALGAFPPEVAVPTLALALQDTSSRVRRSAVSALGRIGGQRALALARGSFQNDPSYEVRASALVSVARMDRDARREVVATGLDTPSYRDIIQSTALDVIAAWRDTTFIPELERMLGTQPRTALTLATLAANGNSHALEILGSHLNDDRSWVRGWVVTAFAQRVPSKIALPHLESLFATLKYRDTKGQVGEVVARLTGGE
jgi:aminopeptidase N